MLQEIQQLALALHHNLQEKELNLTTAESCTGGGLAYVLTAIPGSSAWFERGFVTYSNLAKIQMLQVSEKTLSLHGSVSLEAALEMAAGALNHSVAQISIAITGIAGPGGGSVQKPVGTVFIAIASTFKPSWAQDFLFLGPRDKVREQTLHACLKNLLAYIS